MYGLHATSLPLTINQSLHNIISTFSVQQVHLQVQYKQREQLDTGNRLGTMVQLYSPQTLWNVLTFEDNWYNCVVHLMKNLALQNLKLKCDYHDNIHAECLQELFQQSKCVMLTAKMFLCIIHFTNFYK